MTTADKLFNGAIPEIYDKLLVPLIFEPYALDLAKRVAATHPRKVLETAAGTGVLTRAIALQISKDARLSVTDLNPSMLAQAARQLDDRRIEWAQADALALPYEDRSFDVVACQFGAMFFPDKVQAYKEAFRVLRPGGHFYFNVWDRISENEFADSITEALAEVFPHDPPRFMARTPHGYNDGERIRKELNAAGFTKVSIEVLEERSRASSPLEAAIAYCQGTPLRNEIESRDESLLESATRRAADALERRFGKGAIEGRIRALVVTAT